jgi:hypothetical protein
MEKLRANFSFTRELLQNEIYPWKKGTSGWVHEQHNDIQFVNNEPADTPGHQVHEFLCLPLILILIFEIGFFYSVGFFVLMLVRLPEVMQGVWFGSICLKIPSCST